MRILSLAGWGQPAGSVLLPGLHATPVEYVAHGSLDEALAAIADTARNYDAVIGWSLGGQLAALAISTGLMRPEKLVLIASPFQFVKSDTLPLGMPRPQYHMFRDNYATAPKRTLNKAWELVIKDDAHEHILREKHLQHGKKEVLRQDWLRWLRELDDLTCHGLPFDHFPPSLLLHGDKDAVVYMEQSEHYANLLPQAKLVKFTGCGHAPHWHDPQKTAQAIRDFLGV